MKKFVSKILILCLVFSMFSIPASAVTPEEQLKIDEMEVMTLLKIDAFIAGVESLDNKDEFVNMLVLLRDVDNEEDFAAVYTQMFESLLPGQQDRLASFGATIDAASAFGNYFMNEGYSISNLENYLGLGADKTYKPLEFKASLVRRSTEFATAVKDVDVDNLEAGFLRLNKLFGLLHLAQTIGDGKYFVEFLNYNFTTEKLTLLESEAAKIIVAANIILDDKIEAGEYPIDGFQKLVDYVNGESPYPANHPEVYYGISESDKIRILTYLGVYGFVEYPEPLYVVTTRTTTNTRTVFVPESIVDFNDSPIPLGAGIFNDLFNRFSWAQIAIRQLYIADILKGKTTDTFDPAGFVTRAEFAAMLTRMFDKDILSETSTIFSTASSSFSDILSSAWFLEEVESAYRAGYVKGVGKGLYAPYESISREQIATMISRVLEEQGIIAPVKSDYDTIFSAFTDANSVSEWAKPGSAMCADLGLITGKVNNGQTEFGFSEFATRAEIAVILYRMVEKELVATDVVIFGSEEDAPVEE